MASVALGATVIEKHFTLARADHPAELEVAYPERLSRGLVLVKWWLLASPHYLVVGILLGTVLLSIPAASEGPGRASPLTALFTATSAVCVTGLVVVDTEKNEAGEDVSFTFRGELKPVSVPDAPPVDLAASGGDAGGDADSESA